MITAQEIIPDQWWREIERRFECSHEHQEVVRYQQSNGSWRVRKQCKECGEYTTSDLSHQGMKVMSLPIFDKKLRDSRRQAKQAAKEEARQEHAKQHATPGSTNWWDNYNQYLSTYHWKMLRQAVIKRDSCRCQNCFRQVDYTTAHVHHLSYVGFQRVGKSFAFECVTLCERCHVDFHPHMQNGY